MASLKSSPCNKKWHIAIVGAGLSGTCLALLLAREQPEWNILLLDTDLNKAAPSSAGDDHRASALSASTVDVFTTMGLWPSLAADAAEIVRIDVSDRGYKGAARLMAAEHNLDAYGHVVSNTGLKRTLDAALSRFDNITQRKAQAPTRLVPEQDGMRLALAGERADLVVLAGGEHRALAEQMGISFDYYDYERTALVATLTMAKTHDGIAYEHFTAAGAIALLPLSGGDGRQVSLVWTLPIDRAKEIEASAPECVIDILNVQLSRIGQVVALEHVQSYPVKKIIADEQVRSHLLLLGNAAHLMHPVAGQGFNLSVRDMATLVELLSQAHAQGHKLGNLGLLQRYESMRLRDQNRTIGLSDKLPKLFGMEQALAVRTRSLGLMTLDLIPPLRHRFARLGAGLMTRRARLRGKSPF